MQKKFIRNTICMAAIVMSMLMTTACGTPEASSESTSAVPSVQSAVNLPAATTETRAVVVNIPATQASTAAASASAAAKDAALPAAATKASPVSTYAATKAAETATQPAAAEVRTETSVEPATEAVAESASEAVASEDNGAGNESAVESSDNNSIGHSAHYVLNNNTMKFHIPGCVSIKQIKPANYAEFDGNRETLIGQGYAPCGKCHP